MAGLRKNMTPEMQKCLNENQAIVDTQQCLPQVKSHVEFKPTESDKRLKASFWATYEPDPLSALTVTPTLEDVCAVLPFASAELQVKWDKTPYYSQWFLNKNENKARLEYLFGKALDVAMNILDNEDPKAQSARVQMIKLISELANKVPKPVKDDNSLSEFIGKMDKTQLTAFVTRGGDTLELKASRGDKDTKDGE